MSENKIMKLMDMINYGWVDKNGKKHIDNFEKLSINYILQSPNDLIKSQVGLCWDQVELERYYFKNNVKTFFIVYYDNDKCPTHTFLIFEKDNLYCWFEHSWKKFRGINTYSSLKELLSDVKNKFVYYELNDEYNEDNLVIYEYEKPKYNISVKDFYNHCENGTKIDLDKL